MPGQRRASRRRLSEEFDLETIEIEVDKSEKSEVTTDSEDTPRALSSIVTVDAEVGTPMKSVVKPKGRMPPPKDIVTSSRVIVPYPFVPDDEQESIQKAKTPLYRRMPPQEQLLDPYFLVVLKIEDF